MTAQTILPANSAASGGFDVANSVRLTGTNDYFHKTPSSSGSQRLFSFSAWVKKADFSTGVLFSSGEADGNPNLALYFDSSSRINMYSTQGMQYITTRVFRDPSAWYHIVFVVDTENGTENDRQQLYVNGVRETVFTTSNVIGQNENLSINTSAYRMAVGTGVDDDDYFGGYMAEVVFVDNQALASTSFGEFDSDSGIWKPKNVNPLTFGTNGFYLNFQDSSNLGNDINGGTDLTEVNLAATDQSTDTCTNNFATFNAAHPALANATFSEGNLQFASDGSASTQNPASSSIAVSTGKWYAEFNVVAESTRSGSYSYVGVAGTATWLSAANNAYYIGNQADTIGYNGNQAVYSAGNEVDNSETNYANGNIVGVAADFTNSKIYFHVNGTYINSGDPAGASNGYNIPATAQSFYYFGVSVFGQNASWQANFGSPPYAISSGNADADGHGNFEYAVPSGYFALCSKNLAEYG